MAKRESIHNHTVDPKTGFLESSGYVYAFDADKKSQFLARYRSNGLAIYQTCKEFGISHHTINKHYQIDKIFKAEMDHVEREYVDQLEAVSRTNALNPKAVLERIFQLRSLLPAKYADQKSNSCPSVVINFDGKFIEEMKRRENIIEAQIVPNGKA